MRVLHIDNEKIWRGGERQVFLTVQEQRRQGVDGWIACRRGSPLEEVARNADIPTMGLASTPQTAWPALIRAMRSFDVVHCHTGNTHSIAALATMIRRKPIVLSRRVDNVPHDSWFNRWKYRRVDIVACVSRYIALQLEDWGLPPATMRVIYEAVPDEGYLPREICLRQLRERTGVAPGTKLIGNIAALVGHKDHSTLLRATREIIARRRDVAVIIIGDGEMKEQLLRLLGELGLNGFVHFTGFSEPACSLRSVTPARSRRPCCACWTSPPWPGTWRVRRSSESARSSLSPAWCGATSRSTARCWQATPYHWRGAEFRDVASQTP